MRVTLETSGGIAVFPGRSRALMVDADALSAADARRLAELVAALGPPGEAVPGGGRTRGAGGAGGARDARRYVLIVEHDGTTHRHAASDPVRDPAFRALRDFVEDHGASD